MKHTIIHALGKTRKPLFWLVGFILILPVIVLPPSFSPSDWTRTMLLKTAVTVLAGWLLYMLLYRREKIVNLPGRKNPAIIAVLALTAFCAVAIIATIFSQDALFSFFGSPVRAGGTLNLLFFAMFALVVGFSFSRGELHTFIKINFFVGIFASAIAFIQYFGFLAKIFIAWETGGPPSFLGNSTFLAIYMLFLTFASLTFFLSEASRKKRLYYAALFVLFLATILISGSRATYFGMLIASAFYFLFFPVNSLNLINEEIKWLNIKRIKLIRLGFIILIAAAIAVLAYVNLSAALPSFIENNPRLSHFFHNRLSIQTVWKDLTGTRFSAWTITLEAIKEKPWLGWGPENSYIGFEKHFDPTLPPSLQRLWWDRPHNIFLEVWQNMGIAGLIAYAAFWVVLLWQLHVFKRRHQSTKDVFIAHAIEAMFVGYLIALSFQFDGFATLLISFFFIGYSLHLISMRPEAADAKAPAVSAHAPAYAAPLKHGVFGAFLLAAALFAVFFNLKPLYLNEKIIRVQNREDSGRCKEVLAVLEKTKVERYGILIPYAALRYSDTLKNCAQAAPQKEAELARRALSSLALASTMQPHYTRTWLFMGGFANVLAARESEAAKKQEFIAQAKEYLARAASLSPKRQEVLIELERSHLLEENYPAMIQVAQQCIGIDPSNGACYWYLGVAQVFMGNQQEGRKHADLAVQKNYAPSYKQLAIAYMSQKNWGEAAAVYEKITPPSAETFPAEAVSYHATLAYLYNQNKEYEKAGRAAIEVFKIQPGDPETVEFLRLLVKTQPNSLELHTYLAHIYRKIGEKSLYQKELAILENAYAALVQRHPQDVEYRFAFAQMYKDLVEYAKATSQLIIIAKSFPAQRPRAEGIVQAMGGEHWATYAIAMGIK